MDDLTEVFTFPSWPEINSMGKIPWNCNDGKTANAMNIDTTCVFSGPQKMVSMSTTPSLLGGSVERQGLRSEGHGMQASLSQPHTNYGTVYHHHHSEDVQLAARLNHVLGLQSACNGPRMSQSQIDGRIQALPRGLQEAAHDILQRLSRGSSRLPKLARSPSMCSSGSEISSCQQLSSDSQSVAPLRHHTYTGGIFPSPFGLGHSNAESLRLPEGTPFELHHLRKRPWDDEARVSPQESMFNTSDRGQAPQIRSVGQHSHSQPQGAAVVVAGTARPRTRARRGQATDPHSIAERLRRERIAVRMKALQELVPSSNKADKASLLDDIIEYVKFLQLQAKVFSISRLGGTGAVAPLVADISAEGHSSFEAAMFSSTGGATGALQDYNMDVTEEEVLKLMEVDMGSAMRFLQTKGMCLMPISLATAISRKDARHSTGYTRAID